MIRRSFLRGLASLFGALPFFGKTTKAAPHKAESKPDPEIRDVITAREHRLERALLMIEFVSENASDERPAATEAEKALGEMYGIAHSALGHCDTCSVRFEERMEQVEKAAIVHRYVDQCPLCGKPAVGKDNPHPYCCRMEQFLADR